MEDTIHIAFGFDQNYAMPCGVAMLSVCLNTPGPICFHALISENVTDDTKKTMENMVKSHGDSIVFHVVDQKLVSGTHIESYFSYSNYYRLLLPVILPDDVKRVIYLDCDLITVASLQPLWETELDEDVPAALAYDSGTSDVKYHNCIGIPLEQPYFNTGVILMNLDCWRKEGLSKACIENAVEHCYRYVDQDALNIVIGTRIKHVHFRYNLQQNLLVDDESQWLLEKGKFFNEVYEAKADPAIIHFSGWIKPWHEGCENAEDWLKVKSMSPWKDEPLRPRPFGKSCSIQIEGLKDEDDDEAVRSIAQPLLSLAMGFARKHKRAFVFFRKAAWTMARKKKLI